jgi:hypothetical protein
MDNRNEIVRPYDSSIRIRGGVLLALGLASLGLAEYQSQVLGFITNHINPSYARDLVEGLVHNIDGNSLRGFMLTLSGFGLAVEGFNDTVSQKDINKVRRFGAFAQVVGLAAAGYAGFEASTYMMTGEYHVISPLSILNLYEWGAAIAISGVVGDKLIERVEAVKHIDSLKYNFDE